MGKLALFKPIFRIVMPPAVGALGLWLLTELPAVHQAMCNPAGF